MLRRSALLLGAGLVSEGVYLALAWRLPWWRYGGSLQSWSQLLGTGWQTFLVFLVGLAILAIAYLLGWFAVAGQDVQRDYQDYRRLRRVIWGGAILFAVTLFWMMPITSDLFTYLSQAHALTDLQANPLLHALLDMPPSRLILAYPTWYATRPSVYGPGWLLLSAPGTLGSADVATGLFYLKGLAVVAYLLSGRLLEVLLRKVRPEAALEALYLFAWNPLVLLMAVGEGHNDIVMMVFVLLGFWCLLSQRWALAFTALALSVSIKYVSAAFLVPCVVYVWQSVRKSERWPVLILSLLAAAGTLILVTMPLWLIESPAVPAGEWLGGTIQRLLVPSNWRGGTFSSPYWMLGAGALLFAIAYAVLIWRLVRQDGVKGHVVPHRVFQRVADTSFVISLLVFVLGAARSQPWYVIWPAALAGLSKQRWAWPVLTVLTVIMLGTQLWVEWGTPGWPITG